MKIAVQVKPGSSKGPLVEQSGADYIVYLREKPHDGEANTALIKVLAEHFGVAKSCINIRSGATSRRKVVEIIGA